MVVGKGGRETDFIYLGGLPAFLDHPPPVVAASVKAVSGIMLEAG
jgi:hypothetical protein